MLSARASSVDSDKRTTGFHDYLSTNDLVLGCTVMRSWAVFGDVFQLGLHTKLCKMELEIAFLQRPVLGKRCAVAASVTGRNHTLFSMLNDSREHAANWHSGSPLVDAFGRTQSVARRLNLE